MDAIVGILVLLFILTKIAKSQQNKAKAPENRRTATRPSSGRATVNKPTTMSRMDFKSTVREIMDRIEELPRIDTSQFSSAVNQIPMGESYVDDDGCIGGSLPGHSEEGESRKEHQKHMERSDAPQVNIVPPPAESKRPLVSAKELRRAVVMAEILDKPKALRHSSRI